MADGSEVTTYTYDSWGRVRGIDYPRSGDVSMGWDGENRRVWVQDGAGRRDYTYDAWGRVREQRGCCGDGIEVVAVSAEYDKAGRMRNLKELREDGSLFRLVTYDYDELGRFRYATDGHQQMAYRYDIQGRLWKVEFPERTIEYTYYGTEAPTQIGRVRRMEYIAPDGTLQYGSEYIYDLLGRVVASSVRYTRLHKLASLHHLLWRLRGEWR